MKHAMTKLGAALIALALLIVPALAFSDIAPPADQLQFSGQHQPHQESGRIRTVLMLLMGAGLVGVVTVNYLYPVAGATPPTAVQSSQVPTVTGTVNWADADTIALFTHNLGIATAPGFAGILPAISQGFPEVIVYNTGAATVAVVFSIVQTSGNVMTINKGSILGTNGTILVTVRRPHTMGL